MKLNVMLLGKCDYQKALDIQYDILKKRQDNSVEDTLILVEHPPVITLGTHANESNVIIPEKLLNANGIQVFQTNRGGDVTYHGPGQIVGYPIVNLRSKNMGIRVFVRTLEELFVQLLKDKYNIEAGRDTEHTGVWVGNKKVVAIGLAVKRGVTMHGFAFNVNTNLDHFNWIVPCGISDRGVTSVQNITGSYINFEDANKSVLEYFCKLFNYDGYEILDFNSK